MNHRILIKKIASCLFLLLLAAPAAAADLEDVERLLASGRYEEAERQFFRLSTELSRREEAHYLSLLARISSNPAEVEAALRRTAYDLGDSAWRDDALYDLGEFYLLRQDAEAAIQAFEALIEEEERSPHYEGALYWLGTAQLQSGHYEEARGSFKRLINEFPDGEYSMWARVGLGDAFYKEGRYEDSVEAYREILVLYPHSGGEPWIYLQMARGLSGLDRHQETAMFYEYLLRTYPTAPESYMARADRPDLADAAPDPVLPAPGTPPAVAAVPDRPSSALPPVVIPPPVQAPVASSVSPPEDEAVEWNYSIQVGALRDADRAEVLVAQMSARGIDCYVVRQGNFYKVRTGRYAAIEEARSRAEELKAAGIDCFIVSLN